VRTLAPGHGRLMDHVPEVMDALIAHRLARQARVANALERRGRATVEQLLAEVYADVTEAQLAPARFSLWANLRALAEERRAVAVDGAPGQDTMETCWRWAAAS
jgi:hypothetical protein